MVSLQLIRVYIYALFIVILLVQVWCQRNCGRAYGPPDLEGYVIGGEDAEQGAWPWMVALMELNDTTGEPSPICSGFLIDKRLVISAAHCIRQKNTSLYTAKIGHVNLELADTYSISSITTHEGFQKDQFYDDIVLLTLSREVDVPNFNPICLPPRRALRNLTGRGTTIVGWGATIPDGPMSLTLKQLESVPVVSNEFCNTVYGGHFQRLLPLGITSGMICVGSDEPGKDSCVGDSGGPLMIQEQNRWYAVGVAAFGVKCGRTEFPGVYTRVSEYLTWINEKKRILRPQISHGISASGVTGCGCGISSTGCRIVDEGSKECFCRPGHANKEGLCTACACGRHSRGCRFKLNGKKQCVCHSGYSDQNGRCADRRASSAILDMNFPGRLIFYFVFDVSNSLAGPSFRRSVEFAKAIVRTVGISESGARAGAVTFSPVATIQFFPVQYSTTARVLEALDQLSYTGTSSTSALAAIRTEMIPMTQRVLSRQTQKSIIFILTDGETDLIRNSQELREADLLKAEGAEIYCISTTNEGSQDSLYRIASDPRQGHVFILQKFSSLSYVIQAITKGEIDYSECGLGLEQQGRLASQKRILGARPAPDLWPWMAVLDVSNKAEDDIQLQCSSASIIHQKFVLTAVNCLYTPWSKKGNEVFPFRMIVENEINVNLGLSSLRNGIMQVIGVEKILIPARYSPIGGVRGYDIAVLKLKRSMDFNEFVRPICLPTLHEFANTTLYKPGEIAVAIGWRQSAVGESENTEGILEEVFLPIQPFERCDVSNVTFSKRMLCAGSAEGDSGTCNGDRGGPLIQPQENKDGYIFWTQVGVSVMGQLCDKRNSFEYFTNVRKMLEWINKALKQ